VVAAEYPAHWEADVVLLDGSTAHLRPIRSQDAARLVAFYDRVSERSKYLRFFAPYPQLTSRDLDRFTRVDHHRRVALVVTRAGDIVGVGRFDRSDGQDAEIAFLVEDAYQGRGVAQLLLEHLAQAGRERGVRRFVADVLPDNERMVNTLRDAGYQLSGGYEDGVLHLTFPIEATDTAVSVMRAREQRAEASSMRRIFTPRSVAVVGASRRQDTLGQAVLRNLVRGGYTGRIYVVNTAADAVAGHAAYPSVHAVPEAVDLAVIAVPAEVVPEVVSDCAAGGVHALVVVSAGFGETGAAGRARQRELVEVVRSSGMRLVGPNALGIINTAPRVSLNASAVAVMPAPGRVGFFSQSGSLGAAILARVERRGLGLSTFISAGNRADVSANDLLQYWEADPATEVVLLYLESIGNPRKFTRIARRVARSRPVVAVKSGRTTQGVPRGHAVRPTAVPPAGVDAMFAQAGVVQVDSLDALLDAGLLLAHQPLPAGRRVAIVGNSDALTLLAADAASSADLEVAVRVDLGPGATAEDFDRTLDAAIGDPGVDAVLVVYMPPLDDTGQDVAAVLAAAGQGVDKPLLSTFLASEGIPEMLRAPGPEGVSGRGSVPSYPAPEEAVRALASAVRYAGWRRRPPGELRRYDDIDPAAARRVVEPALGDDDRAGLDESALSALLAAYGIGLWPRIPVHSRDEAVAAAERLGWQLGCDVVLKSTAQHLRSRPDLAHVWRSIDSAEGMREAWETLTAELAGLRPGPLVVQRMADPGVPIVVTSREDPSFGPVVSLGVAGVASELLGDVAYRIPPLTDTDAADMVRSLGAASLLLGERGGAQVDLPSVEDLLQRVARLQDDLEEMALLSLDLVMAGSRGVQVLAASATVEVPEHQRADSLVRRLTAPPGEPSRVPD
jgi:acyl-CoA synthetase (NDP forming)/RimJ/RimL family protein N-acetyltransferase